MVPATHAYPCCACHDFKRTWLISCLWWWFLPEVRRRTTTELWYNLRDPCMPLFVNPQLRPQLLHDRLKSWFQWWTCFFLCNATKHDDNSHKRRNEVNLVAFDRISVQTAKVRFLMSANFDRRNSAAGPLPVLNSSTHWREDEQREKMQFECALLPLMDPSRPSYSIFCLSAGSGDECDSW